MQCCAALGSEGWRIASEEQVSGICAPQDLEDKRKGKEKTRDWVIQFQDAGRFLLSFDLGTGTQVLEHVKNLVYVPQNYTPIMLKNFK